MQLIGSVSINHIQVNTFQPCGCKFTHSRGQKLRLRILNNTVYIYFFFFWGGGGSNFLQTYFIQIVRYFY